MHYSQWLKITAYKYDHQYDKEGLYSLFEWCPKAMEYAKGCREDECREMIVGQLDQQNPF